MYTYKRVFNENDSPLNVEYGPVAKAIDTTAVQSQLKNDPNNTTIDEKLKLLDQTMHENLQLMHQASIKTSKKFSELDDFDNKLSDALSNESAARAEADDKLSDALSNESAARADADDKLSDALSNESAARTEADTEIKQYASNLAENVNADMQDANNKLEDHDSQLNSHSLDITTLGNNDQIFLNTIETIVKQGQANAASTVGIANIIIDFIQSLNTMENTCPAVTSENDFMENMCLTGTSANDAMTTDGYTATSH